MSVLLDLSLNNESGAVFDSNEMFVADINPANDHSYSLKVQTEPEVEVETAGDDATQSNHDKSCKLVRYWMF
jgi:hypothetical protein